MIEHFSETAKNWNVVSGEHREDFLRYISRVYQNRDNTGLSCEFEIQREGENRKWYRVVCETICSSSGKPVKAVGYYIDITREKNAAIESRANRKALELLREQEERLTRMAETDALTGLYNRQTAIPRIKSFLSSMDGQTAALIMLDLDNFKLVNDVFGHVFGDSVIAGNAKKLKSFFRADDISAGLEAMNSLFSVKISVRKI